MPILSMFSRKTSSACRSVKTPPSQTNSTGSMPPTTVKPPPTAVPQQQQQQQQQPAYGFMQANLQQQQQQQQQHSPDCRGVVRKLPCPAGDEEKDLASVVVTLVRGSTYDPLFTKYPQSAPEGRVAVYAVNHGTDDVIAELRAAFEGNGAAAGTQGQFAEMLADVRAVESNAVVFNFECCSGHSTCGGAHGPDMIKLTRALVDAGHMVMFSDFSLKVLIAAWDERLLGPKTFKQIGECRTSITLAFDSEPLLDCPSAQLQALGNLCGEKGEAAMHCMPSTIVYTTLAGPEARANPMYKRTVLTRVSQVDGKTRTDDPVGHAVLEYGSGGCILTSAGHWVELQRIDTSEEAVKRVAIEQLGAADYAAFEQEYNATACPATKAGMLQMKSAECVQRSAPCRYSKKY